MTGALWSPGAGGSWQGEVNRLRKTGVSLPNSPSQARNQAASMFNTANNTELISHFGRRRANADANRQRLGSYRTGSNLQIALPKDRQPMGSLGDKGIPYNVEDEEELKTIRSWARLFYATHDLVPLLIDIYCLAGDTRVITYDQGTLPISELSGRSVKILTKGGHWTYGDFKSFGRAPLWEITLSRHGVNKTISATSEHRWYVNRRKNRNKGTKPLVEEVLTRQLSAGDELTTTGVWRNELQKTNCSTFGIAHGFVYGDGTLESNGGATVDLHGEKDAVMMPYFNNSSTHVYEFLDGPNPRVYGLPSYFKRAPELTESASYLAGWLAGYFAADGTVNKQGQCFIDSADQKSLELVRDVCNRLGIWTFPIYDIGAQETTMPNGAKYKTHMWRVNIDSFHLKEDFFCIQEHRRKWNEAIGDRERELRRSDWKVESVVLTDRVEEVFCATVPETESFVLEDYILTGNSKFPVVGFELSSKDPLIQSFYEDMFLGDDLNYLEFLPNEFAREYFTSGEVTSLAHFNESLGVWSSEEILNPDTLRISRSLFVQRDRVQLMVKELVDNLRQGPMSGGSALSTSEESPSERLQRTHEYCCTPNTRVLTADLRWVPVSTLVEGQAIMGFDEYPRSGRGSKREWVPTRVTATKVITGNTYRVVTDGPSVECTDQHRWLAIPVNPMRKIALDTTRDEEFYPPNAWKGRRSKPWVRRPCHACSIPMEIRPSEIETTKFCSKVCSGSVRNRQYSSGLVAGKLMWMRADELRPGDKISYLGQWDVEEDSRSAGWMGGFLDGEGSLGTAGITFGQNVGAVLDRALEILDQYKFSYSCAERPPHENSGKVQANVRITGGWSEVFRALSVFRPVRFLEKFADLIHGVQIVGDWVTVTSVDHVGEQDVIALATSSKTLVAEGMFSHNTELQKHFPEIIQAAAQDDGLDISDALISRVVNRSSPWAKRGTPHLLRSFRTLMMEESLYSAQNAICVTAGTPVLTSTGIKCVENIATGDEVLTHQGRYRRVVRPMTRQADESGVTIRWWYDQPLTLTGEHPVYIRRPINMPRQYNGQRHSDWTEGFLPAREVRTYDQVLHPSSPDSGKEYVSIWEHLDQSDWVTYDPTDEAFGMTGHQWYDDGSYQMKKKARGRCEVVLNGSEASPGDILRHNRFGAKSQHFAAEYKLTEDLLWLIGLHVADGSAQVNGNPPHGSLIITLGEKETVLQQRAARVIRETFGLEPKVAPVWGGAKAVSVIANCLPLASWFREMCGVKDTKRFPSWAFGLTSSQTSALIEGWMDGDGTTNEVRTLGGSAHRHVQESAAWLMRRSGLITSSRKAKRSGGYTDGGFEYTVTTVKTPRRAYLADQGGYWAEVRSVDHHQVTETVYNLEVEEDNSYCAPVAVHNCDRLYSPLILATLGIEDMGDGEPWIPDQSELDDTRDDMQSALAADFRLMVHNFGLKIENVFGRESVPNLDADFQRIDAKLLQAWGIGEALISGGTGGAYASSALNREFVTQIMVGFQNSLKRHIRKRAEVIAEAQGHYDYDLKGGLRVPIYREIVETDPETGEEYIRKVPKLLVPDVKFSVLNLRDEAQERAFIAQLKSMGVPVSDKMLAVNIDMEFDQELERQADESVQKLMATAQAMKKVQDLCDQQDLPYPPELAQHLMSTLQLRQGKTQTELGEAQAVAGEAQAQFQEEQIEMQEEMLQQQMATGMPPPGQAPPGQEQQGAAPPGQEQGAPPPAAGAMTASRRGEAGIQNINGPTASPPAGAPPSGGVGPEEAPGMPAPGKSVGGLTQTPAESHEQAGSEPRQASEIQRNRTPRPPVEPRQRKRTRKGEAEGPHRLSEGPSSYGTSRKATTEHVEKHVQRLEAVANWRRTAGGGVPTVAELVADPNFYKATNMTDYQGQIQADWPEIMAGGASDTKRILEEMVEQWYQMFGAQPVWE